MVWTTTATARFLTRVNALLENGVFQERVALVRAGLSWIDASRMVGSERRAFVMAYNSQEQAGAAEAERTSKVESGTRRLGRR